jgi:hypothetical protein
MDDGSRATTSNWTPFNFSRSIIIRKLTSTYFAMGNVHYSVKELRHRAAFQTEQSAIPKSSLICSPIFRLIKTGDNIYQWTTRKRDRLKLPSRFGGTLSISRHENGQAPLQPKVLRSLSTITDLERMANAQSSSRNSIWNLIINSQVAQITINKPNQQHRCQAQGNAKVQNVQLRDNRWLNPQFSVTAGQSTMALTPMSVVVEQQSYKRSGQPHCPAGVSPMMKIVSLC